MDLEEELKKETAKSRGINVEQIPSDVLLGERINAKLFQFKLKKQGVDISLWEVFTLYEQLNIEQARVFTEPQRYHHITFDLFFKFITNKNYEEFVKLKTRQRESQLLKASTESAFDLAHVLNKDKKNVDILSNINQSRSEQDLLSDKDDEVVMSERPREDLVPKVNHFEKQNQEEKREYNQVKHIFEVKVQELRDIPILEKLIKDTQSFENAT